MNLLNLGNYKEEKPHHKKRLFWLLLNSCLFPILPSRTRIKLLKLFGTKVNKWLGIRPSAKIYAPWNLEVGNALIGPRVEIYNKAQVTIGEGIVISQNSYLCTASHDITSPTMDLITKPIIIKDNVWIAAQAIILPGVTIGEGAVVGCGAVVAKDVPPWTVVVGNPARVVGKRELQKA